MYTDNAGLILLRGGGDLASGVALRLHRAGLRVLITELEKPLAVRRAVSFAEAVYERQHTVEGVTARLAEAGPGLFAGIRKILQANEIPVLIDRDAKILLSPFRFPVVVDARLTKQPPGPLPVEVPLHIGLGPGFQAGVNCHAVIESRRSHTLGRVYWSGATQADSGQPEGDPRRVLRAPVDGVLAAKANIGEHIEAGRVVAVIANPAPAGEPVPAVSPLNGVLRGLIHDGVHVTRGLKIGDVDPRDDPEACFLISDKALAIGGAVLEAILTRHELRQEFFSPAGLGWTGTRENLLPPS